MKAPIYKILLLEEDTALIRKIQQLLTLHNYDLITSTTPEEGMYMSRQFKPDLIVCGVKLRGGSGYHFLMELRNDPTLQHLPLILISGKEGKEDMRMGMNLGADDFLTKPFKSKELLMSIKSRITRFTVFNLQQREKKHTTIVSMPVVAPEIHGKLSKTELRIMQMIAEGLSTKEIAQALNISIKTVENHRHNISKKLNLTGHNSLIKYAIRNLQQQYRILS
ncbi:response regulator transcription factor [Chitinophaga sancti]|uniref:Response regulator transcription factor n=1 Tax=Chitinophaga sancti TaxID=1004 RepID=A0A1K1NDK0_9BACT|nr:response regulator transcription factor [Chitinophaga sancti]WQD63299.1 response regulator transcription factor [Chitinophaga sancti]WQG91075.1 response regulator transcription factor [Chitinophaga sancti]SFW33427.1 two component transcriptional regulator, LuxR family [Chitinophaga sancti]